MCADHNTVFNRLLFMIRAGTIGLVLALFTVPALLLRPHKRGSILHHHNRFIIWLLGAKIKEVGSYDPNADILLFNHQGIMDIIGFNALKLSNIRWAAKKELFEIPWYGFLLRKGDMIRLDRGSKAALVSLVKGAKEARENGRQIAIFPEGTRAKSQELLPFKEGVAILAKKLNLSIQPVVITGSKALLNEHDKTSALNNEMHFIFMPTITPNNDTSWLKETQKSMQEIIDDQYHSAHRCR